MTLPTHCHQWLVSGADKAPRSPKTGKLTDVRDASLYVPFEEATRYAQEHGLDVGFALTPSDPYTVIDLDNPENPEQIERHRKILEAFDTYAEFSRSGNGIHIWCRGSVPRGIRRDKVEVYSDARYIICTGRSYKDRPINECQELLDILFAEMNRGHLELSENRDGEALLDDQDLFEMASNAVNGEKFDQLCRGEWQGDYPSQSEADFALMNMLCFYSKNSEQVKRLFRYSALGKRPKAQRDAYLDGMISKIRAEAPPEVDISALIVSKPSVQVQGKEKKPAVQADTGSRISYPPGLIGDLARYIVDSSTRPVPEVGTTAALALCAGVLGRQFNISGTGLNQYLILLAKTGVGKEGGAAGIERILAAARPTAPVVDAFVGPGTFASGQAIIRTLDEKPSFFSVLGEFGLTIQMLSDPQASGHITVMRRVLLDLYSKSGKSSVLYSSAYSDKEKNTKTLLAPAMTIFGESTPETFYAGLSSSHVADGLVPRFLIVEYKGDRPERNKKAFQAPDDVLVRRFVDLVEIALRMQANNSWAEVQLDEHSKAVLDAFDRECDRHIRGGGDDAHRQLWNRAHLKALRLAGLLSAADRPHNPIVTEPDALWAVDLVHKDIGALENRFNEGDIGEGTAKQSADVRRIIVTCIEEQKEGATLAEAGVVSHRYLAQRTANLSAFRKDRRGARVALKETIDTLMESGEMVRVSKQTAASTFETSGLLYQILNWNSFKTGGVL